MRPYFFDLLVEKDDFISFDLTQEEQTKIDMWIKSYVNLTANKLVDMSHKNEGWIKARDEDGKRPDEPSSNKIDENFIWK